MKGCRVADAPHTAWWISTSTAALTDSSPGYQVDKLLVLVEGYARIRCDSALEPSIYDAGQEWNRSETDGSDGRPAVHIHAPAGLCGDVRIYECDLMVANVGGLLRDVRKLRHDEAKGTCVHIAGANAGVAFLRSAPPIEVGSGVRREDCVLGSRPRILTAVPKFAGLVHRTYFGDGSCAGSLTATAQECKVSVAEVARALVDPVRMDLSTRATRDRCRGSTEKNGSTRDGYGPAAYHYGSRLVGYWRRGGVMT